MARGQIVVGVDGSGESARALNWAVEEASLRGASVLALHAYDDGSAMVTAPAVPAPVPDPAVSADIQAHARRGAEERLEETIRLAGVEESAAEISRNAIAHPNPAQALVEHSEDAEMLVVGSRGLGGLKGLVLGSVSQRCAQMARCPLVILPPQDEE